MVAQPEVAMIQKFVRQWIPIEGQIFQLEIDRSLVQIFVRFGVVRFEFPVYVDVELPVGVGVELPPFVQRLDQHSFLRMAPANDGQKISSEISKFDFKLKFKKLSIVI